eukprot:9328539-Pyramimonas_sp.AAC.1
MLHHRSPPSPCNTPVLAPAPPPCGRLLLQPQATQTLLELFEHFGGGDGAPLVAFMDSVAKQFGCNVTLGQTFWGALAHLSRRRPACTL